MTYRAEQMTKVNFKNQEYKIDDNCFVYSDSSYADGTIWACNGMDNQGNAVVVYWHSTKLRDEQEARYKELTRRQSDHEELTPAELDEIFDLEGALSEDSDACDWESPFKVEEVG